MSKAPNFIAEPTQDMRALRRGTTTSASSATCAKSALNQICRSALFQYLRTN
jgi:hypothetical protein